MRESRARLRRGVVIYKGATLFKSADKRMNFDIAISTIINFIYTADRSQSESDN